MWEENKEDRIRRRSELYAKGELSLEDFILLESIDLDEEDHPEEETLSLSELDEKRRSEASVVTTVEEDLQDFDLGLVGSDTDEHEESFRSVLKSITKEEFNKLSIYEQQRLYDFDPEAIKKLTESDNSVTEILHEDPKRKFSPRLTVEEFRTMSLKDLNDLYNSDPDLYNRLSEESSQGGSL